MNTKRHFDTEQLAAHERLRRIWKVKKDELQLTQEQVALACGWSSQSAFANYLHGSVPLTTDAILRLAKALRVHPTEIMPELEEILPKTAAQPAKQGEEDEAGKLARMILSLPTEQRAALEAVAKAFTDSPAEPAIKRRAVKS